MGGFDSPRGKANKSIGGTVLGVEWANQSGGNKGYKGAVFHGLDRESTVKIPDRGLW
jgi:hypothetical protein